MDERASLGVYEPVAELEDLCPHHQYVARQLGRLEAMLGEARASLYGPVSSAPDAPMDVMNALSGETSRTTSAFHAQVARGVSPTVSRGG